MYRGLTKFHQDQWVPCCVLEHLECDGVCEISHSVGHIRVHDSTLRKYNFSICVHFYLYGDIKDNTERFEAELVHGVDPVEVVEDEVEDGCPGSRRSVQLPRLKKFLQRIGLEP